jgi:hypothetical protein
MSAPKTTRTTASVTDFLAGVTDPERRTDAQAVCEVMREVTGHEPAMWGTSIVGFGTYRLASASGRGADWPAISFSPRAQHLVIYVSSGFPEYAALLSQLGKHSTGKACLYIRRLSDVDTAVLGRIVKSGFAQLDGATVGPQPI